LPDFSQAEALAAAARRLPAEQRATLRAALERLRDEVADGHGVLAPRAGALIDRLGEVLGGEREEEETRERHLVEKLAGAGQLRSGFLLRALKEGRLGLFEAALARLGDFDPGAVRRAVNSEDRPEFLGLACAAVGIDRVAFPTILEMVRAINAGRPGGGEEGADRAALAFGPFPADRAASAFRRVADVV